MKLGIIYLILFNDGRAYIGQTIHGLKSLTRTIATFSEIAVIRQLARTSQRNAISPSM